MKDPAFLFYTKDFQSGTQDMSCEEVGAYLRLLMYQHQHGFIPDDTERLMRITGIFLVDKFKMVWQTVNQKFNQKDNHLVNERLAKESTERATAKPKKMASATLAGLISANKDLDQQQKYEIKKSFDINDFLNFTDDEIKLKVKEWFYKMVNQTVNNLANADAIANAIVNEDKEKEGTGEKTKKPKAKPKSEVENIEVQFPFFTENFKAMWQLWKVFRLKEHKFGYKTAISEQAALNELHNLAEGNETKAIAIIQQSMAKGWKGFFEIKNTGNGQSGQNSNSQSGYQASDSLQQKIADRLRTG